ncbi:hypothetical protein, partial [Serratia marcescens]|uniref:hypothetical protein n=1 Tax=Serratia marcescens TaxID=615 RepID=UPI0027E3FD2B
GISLIAGEFVFIHFSSCGIQSILCNLLSTTIMLSVMINIIANVDNGCGGLGGAEMVILNARGL